MNRDHINTEITSLIETVSEQYQHISSSKGNIPLIELDIILSNIAKLYEQISHLKRISSRSEAERKSPVIIPDAPVPAETSAPKQELAKTEINSEPLITKEKNPIVSFVVRPSFVAQATAVAEEKKEIAEAPAKAAVELKTPAEPEPAPAVAEISNETRQDALILPVESAPAPAAASMQETIMEKETVIVEEIKPASTKKMTVQTMGLFDSVTTVADQFSEQPTLRDKISKGQTDSSLGKKLQKKPVEDLKKSIGINERFSLINELFDGDLNNYNKAIDMLNQSGGLSEAMVIFKEQLAPKYGWQENNKSYLDLTDLIERRFMK